ncbi:PEP-CTERM sorting domain-containing protein [Cyanothece sp. BG0011]|uniref:PEP-CTERM sorting domain-containing protein n=1 Tax=Cyanothece sp. BG0011 TaxID=2082950 RepID=UPI000D1E4566|nr:PEP-CTERM sorting domain-containing protein [Cyanothece sp. BG0011]
MKHLLKKLPVAIVTGMIALSFPSAANAFSMFGGSYDEATDGDLSDAGLTATDLGSLMSGFNNLKATFSKQLDGSGLDYFTFTIDEGQALEAIVLNSWSASPEFEDIAFIAMQEGDVFDFTFPNSNPAGFGATGLLGWSHLRSTQVGTNKIFEEMADSNLSPDEVGGLDADYFQLEVDEDPYDGIPGLTESDIETLEANLVNLPNTWQAGALGFDTPLGAGTYSMWLRQGNPTEISVDMDFIAIDVPEEQDPTSVPEPTGVLGTTVAFGLMTLLRKKGKRS